jgi:hypothetical protein
MTACDFSRLDGVNGGDQLYGRALDRLNFNHMAIIAGFRGSAKEYVDFLSRFGEPLIYYGDNSGSHADHEAIHRVRYDAEASAKGQLHAIDGSLNIHSAQSLREPRPRYFCMLMVDSGWQDLPVGRNGESIVNRHSVVGCTRPLGGNRSKRVRLDSRYAVVSRSLPRRRLSINRLPFTGCPVDKRFWRSTQI